MKKKLIPLYAIILVLTSACSWYRDMQRSIVDEDKKEAMAAKKRKSVSREQYDELLVKYEELSKKYESLKDGKSSSASSLLDEIQNNSKTSANVDTETVDIFAPAGNQAAASTAALPQDIESELSLYRRGLALKNSNPGEATKIFQQLETSRTPSVKVRAKFQVGEMLYSKQQYDLALQVFDDIISREAHSGVVLDALKYAAVCSDKLGVAQKRDQYTSLLKDIFEIN